MGLTGAPVHELQPGLAGQVAAAVKALKAGADHLGGLRAPAGNIDRAATPVTKFLAAMVYIGKN